MLYKKILALLRTEWFDDKQYSFLPLVNAKSNNDENTASYNLKYDNKNIYFLVVNLLTDKDDLIVLHYRTFSILICFRKNSWRTSIHKRQLVL